MDLSDETTAPQENVTLSRRQRWLIQNQDFLTRIGPLVISIGFVIATVVLWATGKFSADSVGYAGVWFFSFIGAASIFIPVPGLAAVCVAASPAIGLNPLLVGVIAGSAEALGEMTGYLAGLSGKALFERNRFYPRFRDLLSRYGGIILFFGGIVPNPLLDLLGIAAGSMLYPVRKFLLILFVSKSIKSTWIAFGCYWGVTWIENILH